ADRTVRLWSVATGKELLLLRGHQGRATCLSFHPSGHYLASGGGQPGEVKVWDLTRPQEHVVVQPRPEESRRAEAVGFSADGEVVHVARASGSLQSSRAATGVDCDWKRVDLTNQWRSGAFAAFSADGRRLATVSRRDGRVVNLVAVDSGEE